MVWYSHFSKSFPQFVMVVCMFEFLLRKEYNRAVCCHHLFNLYAEHMRNAGLDELQAGIKIGRRNINNLRYVDDTTLWQKSKRN